MKKNSPERRAKSSVQNDKSGPDVEARPVFAVDFRMHHVTLSVRNIELSAAFYERFGFRLVVTWTSEDKSLTIAHFVASDDVLLEMFQYEVNRNRPRLSQSTGNNLCQLGMKHIAFKVADLRETFDVFKADNCETTDIVHGRTGIDYFFVCDPDGNWVEVVHDNRQMDPGSPVTLTS